MRDWDAEFAAITTEEEEPKEQYYPGSNKPIVRHVNRSTNQDQKTSNDGWDAKPRVYKVKGVETEFFTVGQLAKALGRESVTVRKWEREGIIPKATFRVPSSDPRGVRRLYSRPQVEGIVRIATEEGVLRSHAKPIRQTKFTEKVIDLFKSLGVPSQ